jgi:hypothetical protein
MQSWVARGCGAKRIGRELGLAGNTARRYWRRVEPHGVTRQGLPCTGPGGASSTVNVDALGAFRCCDATLSGAIAAIAATQLAIGAATVVLDDSTVVTASLTAGALVTVSGVLRGPNGAITACTIQ